MAIINNWKHNRLEYLETADVRVSLHSGAEPDIDTVTNFASISGSEVSGDGYTAGGVALVNKSVTQDNTNDLAVLDADDPAWTGLDVGQLGYGALRDATNDVVIGTWALTTLTNGGDYSIAFDAAGVLAIL